MALTLVNNCQMVFIAILKLGTPVIGTGILKLDTLFIGIFILKLGVLPTRLVKLHKKVREKKGGASSER